MNTTRAIAQLLRYAEQDGQPAEYVATLWSLRGQPAAEQERVLWRLCAQLPDEVRGT